MIKEILLNTEILIKQKEIMLILKLYYISTNLRSHLVLLNFYYSNIIKLYSKFTIP